MKMTKEDYECIKQSITAKHQWMLTNHRSDYMAYLGAGHSEERIGWDLLNASGLNPFVCDVLYKYLNDNHINTALRTIIKTLKEM